ncbi:MAG: VWA domain-containing protein [Acidobacteria bacterium]|nr:VWA domain-containing protein [Acidobacteriota bacterium]MDA1236180.1 VWA domain-containing protein [Acidobacteriota bacterium]
MFRSEVSLVNVTATVRDANGGVIGGLDVENFRIVDGSEEQKIVVFERQTDRPLSVMLLVDASLSAAVELEFERVSAKRFLANLFGAGSHEGDRLGVMKFSEGVDLLAPLTRRAKVIERALDRIRPESGTSLYDGVLLASEQLQKRRGRRVLIILTDGGDTTSYSTFRQAIEAAQSADVVIYSVIVQPVKADAGRNTGGEHTLYLFAQGTGGKAFVEYGEAGLNRVFSEILENLRTQYLLGYYQPAHDDTRTRYRDIQVTVDLPDATVLARSGYYVPEERKLLPESVPPQRIDSERRPNGRWRQATPAEAAK